VSCGVRGSIKTGGRPFRWGEEARHRSELARACTSRSGERKSGVVALALTTQISPSDPNATAVNRAVHAAITVAVTLAVLVVAETILRKITYGTAGRKRWEIATRNDLDGTRLLVRSRDRARQQLPPSKGPNGFLTPEVSDPAVMSGGGA